ncbi:methionine--tRNA ligase, partial [Bacteroides thetaiotaomicron]|nr:methionine--tRNA ligase [Bacteroides thetaiotaomicron]
FAEAGECLAHSHFKQGISIVMQLVGEANAYIADMEPWKLAKDDTQRERLGTVLWTALQVISDCNVMLTPFLPHTAQRVHETLGRTGVWAAQPEIREVVDDEPLDLVGVGLPELGQTYPIIT